MLSGLSCKFTESLRVPLHNGVKTYSCMPHSSICCCNTDQLKHNKATDFQPEELLNPVLFTFSEFVYMSGYASGIPFKIFQGQNGTVSRPLWTHQLSGVFWLILCFLPALSLSFPCYIIPPPPLTGCHHIFSQLQTTSYSATTNLNTDLALSVPLRREREIPFPQLPPCCRV